MANDWIFTEAELRNTPSQQDGVKYVDELIVRRKACDFIEKMAKALDLPKLAQISADNYLHRFFMRQSLVRYDKYVVAAACVLLGSKAEECPKKVSSIAREYIALRKVVEKDQVFAIQKHDPQVIAGKIVFMEAFVLHTMVYDLTLSHPYKYINENVDKVIRLQDLTAADVKSSSGKIKQVAWSFLNDSAYTCACLRLEAHDLAAGAVYLAGLYENYVPEGLMTADGQPWWTVLSTPLETLKDAAVYLLEAYAEPYISTQVLPAGLSKLVYQFHPPKPAAESQEETDFEEQEINNPVSSPMCVTSPECGSCDHDADYPMKRDGDESPRETALVPGTASYKNFHGTGSSVDKPSRTSKTSACGGDLITVKRFRDNSEDNVVKRRKQCA
ncbi:TPA: hypothetical protein N0F65_007438 [Lagenidium giganteum]|uniref:Cyclin-like domain-containing protein n=1 Tax=Lagenidium giganteum TaxID=4803 RepID=A0AAV2ZCV1_9STRA|nr:TPA: hypothetical protein N0F65_007438 [Lagenidium giganteum]